MTNEERKKVHTDNLKDKNYEYLFKKYGRRNSTVIDSGNTFLDSLFLQFPIHSEKQKTWWLRMCDEEKKKDTPEYQEKLKKMEEAANQVKVLSNLRLGSFDTEVVNSMKNWYWQQRKPYTEKQIEVIYNLIYKYRTQLESEKEVVKNVSA
jgi:hypothetical protein